MLVLLASASLCLAGYGGGEEYQNKANLKRSSAYLNKADKNNYANYKAEQANNAASNSNAANNKAAYYAANQNVNSNRAAERDASSQLSDKHTKAASEFAKGNKKIFTDQYEKLSISSDISCKKLKRFEKEIKKTYYNAASFEKKAMQKDVNVLRKAKA